jgi:hypothetical protein
LKIDLKSEVLAERGEFWEGLENEVLTDKVLVPRQSHGFYDFCLTLLLIVDPWKISAYLTLPRYRGLMTI